MELRVLRYFMTIAREGSITSAANVLHVTQPTLSRQIRDLENELGQKLFIRGSHHMTLTAEGMVLRKRAEEILSMVDKTEAEFHAMESTVSGDIYIGSGETQAIQHIAEIAKEIREDHPGIHYHLYSGNAEDVTERLDKGLLDFGILIQPADISKYDYINIPAKDTWGVIVRRDSPFAEKTSIRKEDLLHVPLICSRQAISKWESDAALPDVDKLIAVLDKLVDAGNTVVVIEHNLDVIKRADHIIDLGPDGGDRGGNIVITGTPEEVAEYEKSYTGQFLKKLLK